MVTALCDCVQGKLTLESRWPRFIQVPKVGSSRPIFLYSVVEVESPLTTLCRHSLAAPSVSDALPSFQAEPRLPRLPRAVVHRRRTFKRAPGSSRRSFVPPDLTYLLAAKCLRTAPTRIGMPLEDSWNHFDSPLSKAERFLIS